MPPHKPATLRLPSILDAFRRRGAIRSGAAAFAAAALAAACGGGGSSSESPAPPAIPPVRLTGASPWADGCDGVAPTGTVYPGAEVEPHVAVDPNDPDHLIAAWQQDRWSDGAARGLRTAVSFDGGRTWTASAATFTRCSGGTPANGGDYLRASDPWVAIGPSGVVWQIGITTGDGVSPSASAVLVARSPDGGASWEPPVTLIRDQGGPFNDKESMSADPTDARYAYAIWDRLEGNRGPTVFARTTDGGASWEPPRTVFDPGVLRQTINNQIAVLPDGALVASFTRLDMTLQPSAVLMAMRSTDMGATWSAPVVVAQVQARGATDPETGAPIRDAANLGTIAAGRDGRIAIVWQDSRFSGGQRDGIAYSQSSDGGLTWSTPARLNQAPAVQAFLPNVHVRGDGTIGVTYYDLRGNTPEPSILADVWLVQSADGVTWTETHVAGPTDYATAPVARGYFLGDYTGLTSSGTTFVPVYALATGGGADDRTDVFATLATRIASAKAPGAGRPAVAGPPTEAMPLTPGLETALAESVRRTLERRRPPRLDRVPDAAR